MYSVELQGEYVHAYSLLVSIALPKQCDITYSEGTINVYTYTLTELFPERLPTEAQNITCKAPMVKSVIGGA